MQDITSCAESGRATAVAPSLVWESPDKSRSIHLACSVIERLEREVIAAFNALPKRGAEAGGLLPGRMDESGNLSVYIDDFAPVACEYRHGPSYLLSDSDRTGLESAIAKFWEEGEIRGDSSRPEFPFGRRWIPEQVEQALARTATVVLMAVKKGANMAAKWSPAKGVDGVSLSLL